MTKDAETSTKRHYNVTGGGRTTLRPRCGNKQERSRRAADRALAAGWPSCF